MGLGRAALAAMGTLPPDGSWMEMRTRNGVLRPPGISLGVWDRVVMGWVPDSFWKPEFDEGDGRNGRYWVVFDDVRTQPDGTKTRRYRLSAAGVAVLAHCANGGKPPR